MIEKSLLKAIIWWDGAPGWVSVDVEGAKNRWPVNQDLYMRCELKNWYATADAYHVKLEGDISPPDPQWVWMEPGQTGTAVFDPFSLEEEKPYTVVLYITSINHPPMDPQQRYIFGVNKGLGLGPIMIVGAIAIVAAVASVQGRR